MGPIYVPGPEHVEDGAGGRCLRLGGRDINRDFRTAATKWSVAATGRFLAARRRRATRHRQRRHSKSVAEDRLEYGTTKTHEHAPVPCCRPMRRRPPRTKARFR